MEPRDDKQHRSDTASPHATAPKDDGVDVTLIRWMLSLTPQERLHVLQCNVRSLLRLRNARSGT